MKQIISIVLIVCAFSNASSQKTMDNNSKPSINLSLEERVEAIDLSTQLINLRLASFENQQRKGCRMVITGLLSTTLGTLLVLNQDKSDNGPGYLFSGVGAGLSVVGTFLILDAPRSLRVKDR